MVFIKADITIAITKMAGKSEMRGRLLTERNIILEEMDMLTEEAVM